MTAQPLYVKEVRPWSRTRATLMLTFNRPMSVEEMREVECLFNEALERAFPGDQNKGSKS